MIDQKAREIAMGIAPGTVKRAHIAARLGIIEGRRQAFEEAAKALLSVKPHYAHGNLKYGDMVHGECIAAIRALIKGSKG